MSKFFFFCLYYTSFSPLWLSILFIDIKSIIDHQQQLKTEVCSIILIPSVWIITFLFLRHILLNNELEGTNTYILKNVHEEKSITSEYLLSYILPLFAFNFTQWDSVILFLIFFITLGYLCIKHNYFSVNIILEFLNYSIYLCELENNDKISIETNIISKRNLSANKGNTINIKSLNNEYKLDVYKK